MKPMSPASGYTGSMREAPYLEPINSSEDVAGIVLSARHAADAVGHMGAERWRADSRERGTELREG